VRTLDLIIIHCSASPNGKEFGVEDITRWHQERGFVTCGYHKVIYIDGSIHNGRPIEQVGAHAEGYNAHSVGVCLIGTDKFTVPQWSALKTLVDELQAEYNILKVVGHRDIPEVHKECPGFSVMAWKENGRKALEGHLL
jgi:N-acetylmuramoyl-L-alanine amidase